MDQLLYGVIVAVSTAVVGVLPWVLFAAEMAGVK